MTPELRVETRRFEDALRRLARESNRSFSDVVNQNARLIASNLAFQTQPFGTSSASKKQGEGAVMRDIGKVYRTAASVFAEIKDQSEKTARAWYKAVKAGEFEKAESILRKCNIGDRNAKIGEFDASFHRKNLNRRGRVSRHRAALITADAKALKAYGKEIASHVGYAKAGWIAAGEQLGKLSRVPAWLRKVKAGQGKGTMKGREINPEATIHNMVQYLSNLLTPSQVTEALRIQREKMERHINYVVSNAAKRTGFQTTGNQGQRPQNP
jgi:hypothetical protein